MHGFDRCKTLAKASFAEPILRQLNEAVADAGRRYSSTQVCGDGSKARARPAVSRM
jgi:hypothetical protein